MKPNNQLEIRDAEKSEYAFIEGVTQVAYSEYARRMPQSFWEVYWPHARPNGKHNHAEVKKDFYTTFSLMRARMEGQTHSRKHFLPRVFCYQLLSQKLGMNVGKKRSDERYRRSSCGRATGLLCTSCQLRAYHPMFSWSQADLARAAEVSPHCVRRALRGEPIARRNAAKIAAALTARLNGQGGNGHIGVQSIQGLQVADLHHKKKSPTGDS